MATTTFQPYTGNGSNKDFTYTFPTFTASEVVVEVDGVVVDNFHIVSYSTTGTNTVRFDNGDGQGSNSSGTINNSVCNSTTGAPLNNKEVIVRRDTDVDNAKATFTAGSSLKAEDLTNSVTQILRALQEEQNTPTTTPRIRNAAITTAKIKADNITSALIADDQIDSEHIAAGAVDLEHMSADSVDSDQYVDGSIDEVHLSNSAVTANKIAANAVTTTEILNGAVTRAKLETDAIDGTRLADNAVDSEHYVDGSIDRIHLEADIIDSTKLADNAVDSEHYVDGSIDTIHLSNGLINDAKLDSNSVTTAKIANSAVNNDKIADGTITSSKLNTATVITASEQASATTNDTSFLTSAAADARFFNISTGDTIKNGDAFPDNDTTIATTAAINDRIVDLVEEVGGFIPVANETSFPANNPDINAQHGQQAGRLGGTIISVKEAQSNLVPVGTTVTIADGAGSGLTVIITGVPSTIPQGFGFLVETTSTTRTFAFHRLTPKATEVTTVAGKATEIGRLGTAAAVEDMSILGTTDVVADMAILGTTDVVSDMNALAVSDVISDMNTLAVTSVLNDMDTVAGISSNVTTVAGIHGNVTTVAGIQANVTTVAGIQANVTTVAGIHGNVTTVANNNSNVTSLANNMANVNNFNDRYQIASNNPSTDGGGNALAAGDLYFNTSANELKVYNGSAWQGGVTATGTFAATTGNTFTGDNRYNDGVKALFGTGSDLEIFHDGAHSNIINSTGQLKVRGVAGQAITFRNGDDSANVAVFNVDDATHLYYDSAHKFSTNSTGIRVIGNCVPSGNNSGQLGQAALRWSELNIAGVIDVSDNGKIRMGDSDDLQIYHDGANSLIDDAGTGILGLRSDSGINLYKKTGNEFMLKAIPDGAVELYHNNVKKFETTSTGATVTGGINATGLSTFSASGSALRLNDDSILRLGNEDADFFMYYQGSSNYGYISTGANRVLRITTNDLQVYDAGNTEQLFRTTKDSATQLFYDNTLKFETIGDGVKVSSGHLHLPDSSELRLGSDNDLKFSHTGSYAICQNHTNNFYFGNYSNSNLIFQTNNTNRWAVQNTGHFVPDADSTVDIGTSSTRVRNFYADTLYGDGSNLTGINTDLVSDTSPQLGGDLASNGHDIILADTDLLKVGTGGDMLISHDGTNSTIHNLTGNLRIRTVGQLQMTKSSTENMIIGIPDGGVELYYDNSKKFHTASVGCTVTGNLFLSGGYVNLNDNYSYGMGSGNRAQIYHSGSHQYLLNTVGNMYFQPKSGENGIVIMPDDSVELYYNNSMKLKTGVGGTYGSVVTANGANGWSGYSIANQFVFMGNSGGTAAGLFNDVNDEWMVYCAANADVRLYYDNVKKFETTSTGVHVTGQLTGDTLSVSGSSNSRAIEINPGGNAGTMVLDRNGYLTSMIRASDGGSNVGGSSGGGSRLHLAKTAINFQTFPYVSNVGDAVTYTTRASIDTSGNFTPGANNSYSLGTSSLRWSNVYTADLNMSNEGSSNDVDGTWGNYTLQEGESDLFLINNRSGKKYKFNLTEVS